MTDRVNACRKRVWLNHGSIKIASRPDLPKVYNTFDIINKLSSTNKKSLSPINYRQCISCRRLAAKESFWRVVRLASSHQIQLDQGMGRSAYLCPQANCLHQAKVKKRLNSSLRAKVPEHIYQNLQERLS